MKIYKIAQNLNYLQQIGVPPETAQSILDYLMSLEGNDRRNAVSLVRKTPTISLQDLQNTSSGKRGYLEEQNIPNDIINYSLDISEKYSVWIAREVTKWINSVLDWHAKGENLDNKDVLRHHYLHDPVSGAMFSDMYSYSFETEPISRMQFFKPMFRNIKDWANQTAPDIMSMSLLEANNAQKQWHEELAQKELDESLNYQTNDIVYAFEDGWNIVKLGAKDCETEGDQMGNCVGGYANRIEQESTQVYSLRDKNNNPHATLEVIIPLKIPTKNKQGKMEFKPHKEIIIEQIQGKGNEEPIDEYKAKIKEWFTSLKNAGYEFTPIESEDFEDDITEIDFEELKTSQDDYGIEIRMYNIGGNYDNNIESIVDECQYRDGDLDIQKAIGTFEALANYAFYIGEGELLEKEVQFYSDSISEEFNTWFVQNYDYFNIPTYPDESDFTTFPKNQNIENQPELDMEGLNELKKEVFHQEEYNKALDLYTEQFAEIEKIAISQYPKMEFTNEMYLAFQTEKAKFTKDNEQEKQIEAKTNKMIKTADKKIPSAEEIAAYVEALTLFLKKGKIKDRVIARLVKNLPYPDKIRMHLSEQECQIVFESVGFAWKEMTGQDLLEETKIEHAPKGLEGNYWMMTGGVLLEGVNHWTIIKQNTLLFINLLGISAFVIHEKMASPPDELIKTVLDNGGMRIFINKKKKGYFQLSDKTYSKWGRNKIKGLDLRDKVVKVVDTTRPYKGWESGILVKL